MTEKTSVTGEIICDRESDMENNIGKRKRPNEDAQYVPERRTIQVLDVLKKISDENHPVTQTMLLEAMRNTGEATTENAATLATTVDQILRQINPVSYWEEGGESNDAEYRIKYKGYDNPAYNPIDLKEEIAELKRERRRKENEMQLQDDVQIKRDVQSINRRLSELGKAPSVTGLRYIHSFSDREMDQLIQLIAFSNAITQKEKENLICKILRTASQYYATPFYDAKHKKLKFHPKGIFSKNYVMPGQDETQKSAGSVKISLGQNISAIQKAINDGVQIRFFFCEYTSDKTLIARKQGGKDREYRISPYYIVVYHDRYYLIGNMPGKKNLSFYRVDLMADIQVHMDQRGKPVKREPMSKFQELQSTSGQWDPVRYMSEHLYMGYEEPRAIRLKIPQDQYTVLHDWFGDYFRRLHMPCEKGFDYVDVMAPPGMMVHWALQYAGIVEVMDEEVREMIRAELRRLGDKYQV